MSAKEDFQKLKVPELKSRLKELGLPVSGNKLDLIDRLSTSASASSSNTTLDQDSVDEAALLDSTELEPSAEDDILKDDTDVDDVKCTSPVKTSDTKDEEPAQKIKITLDGSEEKGSLVTLEQRKLERAKKFGVVSDETKKLARAERFGLEITENSNSNKTISSKGVEDVDKLKTRAERFGTVTSDTLSKEVLEDKRRKRSERFGSEVETKMDDDNEKMRKRKEKFGVTLSGSTNTLSAEMEEKKRKRAERFGLTG